MDLFFFFFASPANRTENAHNMLTETDECYHKSLNSSCNKVQIYSKCFHRFASIRAPASKLIID